MLRVALLVHMPEIWDINMQVPLRWENQVFRGIKMGEFRWFFWPSVTYKNLKVSKQNYHHFIHLVLFKGQHLLSVALQ